MTGAAGALTPLELGAAVLDRLLPIRPPVRMIDAVLAFAAAPRATLRTALALAADNPVFAAHFTFRPLWPASFVQESLAQTAGVLGGIVMARRELAARGRDPDELLTALRALERGAEPADTLALIAPARAVLVVAACNLRYQKPIAPGEHLTFTATVAREFAGLWHFDVTANAGAAQVATGTLTHALRPVD